MLASCKSVMAHRQTELSKRIFRMADKGKKKWPYSSKGKWKEEDA